MVVDYLSMSSVNFAIPDFCSLIPLGSLRQSRVVLAACLGVMAGFGSLFVYTFSVFVKPLAAEFGWSREAISGGFAIAAVTLGLCSPLLGRWIDRVGPRRIILVCMTVYVCAIASLSLLRFGLWQFYVTCFVLGVVGNGAAHLAYSQHGTSNRS